MRTHTIPPRRTAAHARDLYHDAVLGLEQAISDLRLAAERVARFDLDSLPDLDAAIDAIVEMAVARERARARLDATRAPLRMVRR